MEINQEKKFEKKIKTARKAYLNYIDENEYIEYIDLHSLALNVILEGDLLRSYNDKKVYKLENNDSYILVTLTDDERITNIIIKDNALGGAINEWN